MVIERAENGAVLEYKADWEESVNVRRVFEFDNDEKDLSGLTDLLYSIIEQLGCVGGRYDAQRIEVRIVHGDKHECPGCRICRPEVAAGD